MAEKPDQSRSAGRSRAGRPCPGERFRRARTFLLTDENGPNFSVDRNLPSFLDKFLFLLFLFLSFSPSFRRQEIRINVQDPKGVAAVSRLGSAKGFGQQAGPHGQHGLPPPSSSPMHRSSPPPPHFAHPQHLHPYARQPQQPMQQPPMQYRFAPSNGALEFVGVPASAPTIFGAQEELWTLLRPQMPPQSSMMLPPQQVSMAPMGPDQVACRKNLQKMMGVSPSDIDKYSRIFFPVTFTCFNLMYWIIYLHVSDEVAQDLVMLNQ